MFSCKLIGSRARGGARPDSDWDVLVEATPPIISNARWFDELCVEIQKYEKAARAAALKFLGSRPDYDGGEVDVFLVVNWGQTTLALLLEWDDVHCCYGGWLDAPIPE
jgi:predicted nucleotidyltransferase